MSPTRRWGALEIVHDPEKLLLAGQMAFMRDLQFTGARHATADNMEVHATIDCRCGCNMWDAFSCMRA